MADDMALIRPTLAITWPQGVVEDEDGLSAAAQVHGDVRQITICLGRRLPGDRCRQRTICLVSIHCGVRALLSGTKDAVEPLTNVGEMAPNDFLESHRLSVFFKERNNSIHVVVWPKFDRR